MKILFLYGNIWSTVQRSQDKSCELVSYNFSLYVKQCTLLYKWQNKYAHEYFHLNVELSQMWKYIRAILYKLDFKLHFKLNVETLKMSQEIDFIIFSCLGLLAYCESKAQTVSFLYNLRSNSALKPTLVKMQNSINNMYFFVSCLPQTFLVIKWDWALPTRSSAPELTGSKSA